MRVGISACSNGQDIEYKCKINSLVDIFGAIGIEAVLAEHIYAKTDDFSGTDKERASDLMRFYKDDGIDAIYDISGGDLANGILKYLDYDIIKSSNKCFWGYSDLTTVINAIYSMTGKASVLYQVKNLISLEAAHRRKWFEDYIKGENNSLFDIEYEFLQGSRMEGVVVGGNIRCLLKLAGTKYFPDMEWKIILLEALGGKSGQIVTLFHQLEHLGAFDKAAGILLGTFINYERANPELSIFDILKENISESLPVAQTMDIGHGRESKAIFIGKSRLFTKNLT